MLEDPKLDGRSPGNWNGQERSVRELQEGTLHCE
jgi:hypothetical protein